MSVDMVVANSLHHGQSPGTVNVDPTVYTYMWRVAPSSCVQSCRVCGPSFRSYDDYPVAPNSPR